MPTVELTVDAEDALQLIQGVIGELQRGFTADEKIELGNLAWFLINQRTGEGLDMWGDPFAPYSEDYLEFLIERGEASSAGDITVDLLLEGNMRAAGTTPDHHAGPVDVQAKAYASLITFTSNRQARKAGAHHVGSGNLPERPWFNIPEGTDDHEKLLEEAAMLLKQRIEGEFG